MICKEIARFGHPEITVMGPKRSLQKVKAGRLQLLDKHAAEAQKFKHREILQCLGDNIG